MNIFAIMENAPISKLHDLTKADNIWHYRSFLKLEDAVKFIREVLYPKVRMTLSIGSELDEEKFSLFNSSDERNFVIKYKENEYQDYSSDENKFYFNIKEIELPLELVNTISLLGL